MLKRACDLVFASFWGVLLLPPGLLIAVAIRLESPGPALHATPRLGRFGKEFHYYRFRTRAGTPPQYTRLGRFVGNLSLDEIPVLWNNLQGDLSFVGPRPELPDKVDLSDPDWQKVLSVRPGLMGLGLLTLKDRYNYSSLKERIQPEIDYVEHQSLRLDALILVKTIYWWMRMGHIKGKF
jgi:lipopolysaccharide/colanic/teichoic acid biosynthesis glycosyltransferase